MEMRKNVSGVKRDKFVSGEERPTHDLGTCGALQLLVLLVVSVAVSGGAWGACYSTAYNGQECSTAYGGGISYGRETCYYGLGCAPASCENASQCRVTSCPSVNVVGNRYFTNYRLQKAEECNNESTSGCFMTGGSFSTCIPCSYCDSQTEADSVVCVNDGHQWDSTADTCAVCTQNDTTWTEISCAYSPQRGQYLNVSNTYSVVNCETSTRTHQYYAAKCDSAGADSAISCIGSVDGVHVMLRGSNGKVTTCAADGSCDMAIRKVAMGECENPNTPEPTSSSESEMSSSTEGESSSSAEPSSSGSQDSTDWGWLRDTLGHIDYNIEFMQPFVTGIYDGVQEVNGNLYDMKENQRQMLDFQGRIADATESIEGKATTANNLLQQIANKNWSPNINVQAPNVNVENNTDVSGIQSRQDQTRDTLHNTNSLLEQISSKLNGLGNDTIHVDTSKAPASIDSALKYWGNTSNHTYGAAGLDSAGWGAEVDKTSGYSDSVTASTAGLDPITGCDTTGGKKCDGVFLGSNGMSSASTQYKGLYGELGDSLTNGAYADSLNNWASKFGHSRLTGAGSDNCPSILNRTWSVPIGNVNMAFGPIGKYICTPIFGGLNAFALARTLLRAIVAIGSMWFLFKCATGFKGQGGEEDD